MISLNINHLKELASHHPSGAIYKITFNDNKTDFIKIHNSQITSIIDNQRYDESISLQSIEVSLDLHEQKIVKKLRKKEDITNREIEFSLARCLGVDPRDINEKNRTKIISIYREKFLKFINQRIGLTPSDYSIAEHETVADIKDDSVLLQYFLRDPHFYETKFKHNKKLSYFDTIRQKLYAFYFKNKQPFETLYDDDLYWINCCFKFLKIPFLMFADLSISEAENYQLVNEIRNKWLEKIINTHQKASDILKEEYRIALESNDTDTEKEIKIILNEIDEGLEEAKNILLAKKTIRDILRYWPEILNPAPPEFSSR